MWIKVLITVNWRGTVGSLSDNFVSSHWVYKKIFNSDTGLVIPRLHTLNRNATHLTKALERLQRCRAKLLCSWTLHSLLYWSAGQLQPPATYIRDVYYLDAFLHVCFHGLRWITHAENALNVFSNEQLIKRLQALNNQFLTFVQQLRSAWDLGFPAVT